MRRLSLFLVFAFLPAAFFLSTAEGGDAVVTLRETATARGEYIRLIEIAEIAGDEDFVAACERLFVGPSPDEGGAREIRRAEVLRRMEETGVCADVRIEGAETTIVRRKAGDEASGGPETKRAIVHADRRQVEAWIAEAVRARLEQEFGRRDLRVEVRVRSVEGNVASDASGLAIASLLSGRLPGQARIECSPLPPGSSRTMRIKAAVEAEAFAPVAVLSRSFAKGERVTRGDLVIQERPLRAGAALPTLKSEDAVDRVAARALAAMTPLTPGDFVPPTMVEKSRPVVVDTQGEGFRIRSHGIALADGRIGDLVLVEGIASKAKFLARVTGQGMVEYVLPGGKP